MITGSQTAEAINGSLAAGSVSFQKPSNLCEDLNDSSIVYVTDDGNFQAMLPAPEAAILKVQFFATSNPKVTILAKEGYLWDPTGVVPIKDNNGKEWLYVSDTGNTSQNLGKGFVVRIDPTNGTQTQLSGTLNKFQCPVGLAPAYSSTGQVDNTTLWVADQGSNFHNEPSIVPNGTIWKVDLTNFSNASTIISQGGLLTIHTDYTNPPKNQALGNLQNIAVDPSNGQLYVSQYGFRNFAGSVVRVDPASYNPNDLTADQTEIAQDDGITDEPPTPASNCKLGWYVGPVGWDANYELSDLTSVSRVITAAAHKPDSTNQQGGHVCVADPTAGTDDSNVEKISENGTQDGNYIGTPTGIITYTTGGSGTTPRLTQSHSPSTLGTTDVVTADVETLSAFACPSAGGGEATNGPAQQSMPVDKSVPPLATNGRADPFRDASNGTGPHRLSLPDDFRGTDNPWDLQDAYFALESSRGTDW